MRIGIDARMLGPGFGLARYIQQLVTHLEAIDDCNEYVVFMKRDNWDRFQPQKKNFRKVLADIPWYGVAEQIRLPGIIKKAELDLMHFPHWNIPLIYNGRFVMTIHDLTMYHYPRPEATTRGPLLFWIKDKTHRLVLSQAAKKAEKIMVTTEWTKQDIHTHLRVPLEKMVVTYQAPYAPLENVKDRAAVVLEKFHIRKPYVLYVGASYPHKNLEGLLRAWQIFEHQYGSEYELLLAGKPGYFYDRLVKSQLIAQCQNARYLGFVEDNELSALYAAAKLFVYPSLYEGFGLPPLEAMAHGTVVASSNSSCLPEVLGEAALYFHPENYHEMALVMHRCLTDEAVRADLRIYSREELKRYSWRSLAKKTLLLYEQSIKKM